MTIDTIEFKKRFGKKPIDEVGAEDRYKDCLKRYKPKIAAGVGRGEKLAADSLKELHALVAVKDWNGAADLLQEIAPKIAIDPKKAGTLRQELEAEVTRARPGGRMIPPGLEGARKAVEAAIVEDDYADARDQLDDYSSLVDEHLQRCAEWDKKFRTAEGRLKEVETRRLAQNIKVMPLEEGMVTPALNNLKSDIFKSDFTAAEKRLSGINQQLTALLKEPADQSPEGLKDLYDKNLPNAKKGVELWQTVDADPTWAPLKGQIGSVTSSFEAGEEAYEDGEYSDAWEHLDTVVSALAQLDAAAKGIYETMFARLDYFKMVGDIQGNAIPDTDVTKTLDLPEMAKALGTASGLARQKKWIEATDKLSAVAEDFTTLAKDLKDHPPSVAAPQGQPAPTVVAPEKVLAYEQKLAGNPKQAEVLALLKAPDFDAAAFRAAKGATKLLDDMVGALGGKAGNKAAREFVQEAMKCRFGLTEISGGDDGKGMSTKALPRMYQLFALLPASHTTDNDMITSLERQKADDTSWHSGSQKKVVLKAGKTGKPGSEFDETTLHEIAHGVDMKLKFMETNGAARKFGGWQRETKDSVLAIAGEKLGFYKHFEGRVPDALLRKYLDVVLSGANPKTLQAQFKDGNDAGFADPAKLANDPGVKHADSKRREVKDDSDDQRDLMFAARKKIAARDPGKKAILTAIVDLVAYNKAPADAIRTVLDSIEFDGAGPEQADWDEMAVHPAVDFAANAGLKNGSNGLWDQGDSGAQRCSFGGRVYQESYAGDWRSYLLAARSAKVSNYQFRHPMEWFAEVYAKYFVRKLSNSHPLYSWLEEQEGKKTVAVPK